jgi:hypothetical protein
VEEASALEGFLGTLGLPATLVLPILLLLPPTIELCRDGNFKSDLVSLTNGKSNTTITLVSSELSPKIETMRLVCRLWLFRSGIDARVFTPSPLKCMCSLANADSFHAFAAEWRLSIPYANDVEKRSLFFMSITKSDIVSIMYENGNTSMNSFSGFIASARRVLPLGSGIAACNFTL